LKILFANYINRQIEAQLKQAATQFAIIAMTGPRQAGKSTLLKFLFPEYGYFTFDDPVLRKQAKEDPGLFMESVPVHSVLDEIQYPPELLSYLKIRVDQGHGKKGQYILTGSQIFHLMAGLTETLAGRVALFELLPFSFHELGFENPATLAELFEYLHKGFYPDPCVHGVTPKLYYSSYAQTFLEKATRLHLVEIKMRKNIDKADARIVENFTVPDKQLSRWLASCFEHELMIAPATRNLPWWKIRSVL
jgi:hypothetical protein